MPSHLQTKLYFLSWLLPVCSMSDLEILVIVTKRIRPLKPTAANGTFGTSHHSNLPSNLVLRSSDPLMCQIMRVKSW